MEASIPLALMKTKPEIGVNWPPRYTGTPASVAPWPTVRTFSGTKNQIRFTADLPPQSASRIFRVQ